jgi:hypothetical protein
VYTKSAATGGNAAGGFRAIYVKSFDQQVFSDVDLLHAVPNDRERQSELQQEAQAITWPAEYDKPES